MKDDKLIGSRIREIRKERGMTLKELADRLDFSESMISRYEKGKVEIRTSTLRFIANLFDVSYDWLIGRSDSKEVSQLKEDEIDKEKFAYRLALLREEKNITIETLSEKTGISIRRLTRLANASDYAEIPEIKRIADFFAVNPVWLVVEGVPRDKDFNNVSFKEVPILGTIAAGKPITAQEDIISIESVDVYEHIDFCLKVKGNSMINARIFDGDIVYVRKQPTVENGEIAVILIDDEATLKRFIKTNGTVTLRAENPTFKDIVLSAKDYKEVKVLGKAVAFKSQIR